MDSDTVGYALYHTIKDSAHSVRDYTAAFQALLSDGVPKESQPGLFWIASSLTLILEQQQQLPIQLIAIDVEGLARKMQQLTMQKEQLAAYLHRRITAEESFSNHEQRVVGPTAFER